MVIHTKKIFRLRSVEETTFGTDQTASMAGFEALDFTNAQLSYDLPRASTGVMQQKMDGSPLRVSLLKRATLTVTCNLTGQVLRATNGVTHTQSEQGKLWRSYLGGRRLGQGDLVASGSTTTVIELAAIARWVAGSAIAVAGADGRLVARRITDVTGGDATVKPALAAGDVPSAGVEAYNAASYYLGPSASNDTDNTTLQFVAEGLATDDRFLLLGGKVTRATPTFTSGQISSVTYTIQFVDWKYGANAATDLTADTAPLAYDSAANNGLPLVVEDSDLNVTVEDGLTNYALDCSALSIDCQAQWVPVPSTSGINGVIGWARNHNPESVTGSFTIPFESRDWFDLRDADDDDVWVHLAFQVGSNVDFGCALICLKAQITNVQPVEANGLSYQKIDFVGGVPITTDTTDIDDSPFAIHMF